MARPKPKKQKRRRKQPPDVLATVRSSEVVLAKVCEIENGWRQLAAEAITTLREIATSLDGSERSSALAATTRLERRRDTLAGQLELFAIVAFVLGVIAACGDNLPPEVHLLSPADAVADGAADACMREPSTDGCCAYMPDEDAVRACAITGASGGECGVVVCWRANCELARLNFCAPLHADGGCS